MFGYVREYSPELKVKDYALYKAAYCGLCKNMGRCTGQCSRLTLSYDMVFLFLIRTVLENEDYQIERKRCFLHPLKKRPVIKRNSVLDYCAKVSALLSLAKLQDDLKDTHGIKKIVYAAAFPFFLYAKKRAGLEDLYKIIQNKLNELSKCEKEKTKSIDIPAGIFGELTAEIFCFGYDKSPVQKNIACMAGYHVGKWIYAVDALDDMRDDIKKSLYNPIVELYGAQLPGGAAEMLVSACTHSLTEIEKALDLIDFTDASLKALIYNILCEGMKRQADKILQKYSANSGKNDKNDNSDNSVSIENTDNQDNPDNI